MADRGGAAFDVGLAAVQAELLFHRQVLGGEGLVHLDAVHLRQRHSGALQRLPRRRSRADPHDLGRNAGHSPRYQPPDRLETALLREGARGHDARGRPVGDARGVARGHHAVLLEDRRQLGQALERRFGAHVLVGGPGLGLFGFAVGQRNRAELIGKAAGVPRGLGRLLAPERKGIHLGAGNLVLDREIFGGDAHRAAAQGVGETGPEQIFQRRSLAQLDAPAQPANDVGRLAHRFGSRGEHHPGFTEQDLLRALDDGLEAGAAEPVDGERRGLDPATGLERHVPADVGAVRAGLHRVAYDDVVHIRSGNAGALDGGLGRDGTQLGGGEILEGAAEAAEAGTDAGEEYDVGTGGHEKL